MKPEQRPVASSKKTYLPDDLDLTGGLQPGLFPFVTTQLYPLLLDAISYSASWAYTHFDPIPNPDMVACLLRNGAFFDWTYHSVQSIRRPWRHLIQSILACWDDEENFVKWMKIAELALQNGSFIPS